MLYGDISTRVGSDPNVLESWEQYEQNQTLREQQAPYEDDNAGFEITQANPLPMSDSGKQGLVCVSGSKTGYVGSNALQTEFGYAYEIPVHSTNNQGAVGIMTCVQSGNNVFDDGYYSRIEINGYDGSVFHATRENGTYGEIVETDGDFPVDTTFILRVELAADGTSVTAKGMDTNRNIIAQSTITDTPHSTGSHGITSREPGGYFDDLVRTEL
jgi:hypothetical protein